MTEDGAALEVDRQPRARGRVLVVWNANAGRKAGLPTSRADEATLRRVVAAAGLGDEVVATDTAEAGAREVRRAVAEGYDLVIAAGGDGTAGIAARELLGRKTALALLPVGSAMNLARSLGIPRDLEQAAAIAAGGQVRPIDVGMADDRVFLEIGSVGLNAALFAEAQRIDRGRYASLIGLAGVILRYRPARVWLTLDGRRHRMHALMVAVANAPYTGLGLTLAPEAIIDDGLFDVTVFRGFGRWELIRHLGAIVAGRRRYSPKVTTLRARHVLVESRRPLPVRADADDLGRTPITFEVRPAALRVIVPWAEPETG